MLLLPPRRAKWRRSRPQCIRRGAAWPEGFWQGEGKTRVRCRLHRDWVGAPDVAHDGAGGAVVREGAAPRGSVLPLGFGLFPAACRFGGVAAGFGALDRWFGRGVLAKYRGAWRVVVGSSTARPAACTAASRCQTAARLKAYMLPSSCVRSTYAPVAAPMRKAAAKPTTVHSVGGQPGQKDSGRVRVRPENSVSVDTETGLHARCRT